MIYVPSLRERREDIPFLVGHFLDQASGELGIKPQFGRQVLKRLYERDWPGNVAEIKNAVFRLLAMADGTEIRTEDLSSIIDLKRPVASIAGREDLSTWSRLDEMELKELSAALARNRWIRKKAACDLGLTSRQMNYRVKKFGLDGLIKQNRTNGRQIPTR